ncbi:MAG TPA: translocation/assembly module TamB domain-containing protein [Ignavibacteria bacterium]|nr:translocation/assembly module TamB domain-containing protein [Ignavibacteria bacterium]
MAEEKKIEAKKEPIAPGKDPGNGVKKQKKKFRIFSSLILLFSILLLLITLLVSVTQTSFFRDFVKDYLVDMLNEDFSKKQSSLKIGGLEGNFFSEIILKDVLLTVKQDEMIKLDRVKLNYDIFGLMNKTVEVTEAVVNNPTINFVRIPGDKGDSLFNFAYLFSSEDTTKDSSEFEWKINVKRLRMENLNFTMLGAKPQDLPVKDLKIPNAPSFTTDNLRISSLTLETRAQYDKNAIQLWIDHLGFNSNFGFDLKGLSGDFYISKSRAEINKLNIETSRSWVQMEYVFIDKLDLLKVEGLPSFKGKDLRMSLVGKNFDFDDLKAFLPAVDFLNGNLFFELKAKGKFDDMVIEKCRLETPNTDMGFSGRLVNLIDPEHLWLDVKTTEFRIDPVDTKRYTPGLPIPDYTHVGIVTGNMTYKGEPLDFETTFDVQSSVGNAKGFFNMNIKNPNISYNTSVDVTKGNIGKVIKNPKLESDINGHVEAVGSGFALGVINSTVKYELRDTKLLEQKIDKSAGVLNLRGYNVEMDVQYASGKFDAAVKGNVNIRDFNNPIYSLKGQVRNLDISAFTKNNSDKSNLTFAFDVNGRGISPEGLEGTYNINLANSYYGNYDFLATPIDLRISTSGTNDFITLSSNLVDFNAKGNFKLTEIGDVIASNIVMIQNEISKKFKLDTLLPAQLTNVSGSEMDFTYDLKTKDPAAISRMFFLSDMYFDGSVRGRIKNSRSGFDGSTSVRINDFAYKDTVFVLANSQAEFMHLNTYGDYKNAERGDFSSFNSLITFNADTLRIGTRIYDSVKAVFRLNNGIQYYSLDATQDSTIKVDLAGTIDLASDSVTMAVDTLYASFNRVDLYNYDTMLVSYHPYAANQRIIFDKFSLSGDYMKVDIGGYYSFNDSSDIYAEARNINIPAILELIYNPSALYNKKVQNDDYETLFKGSIRRVLMTFKGNIDNPRLAMEMNTSLLRYDDHKVGRVDAFIDFEDNNLSTDILMTNAQGHGRLRLTGNIPFNNPLKTPDSSTYMTVLTSPLDLNLKATNFQINFFSKAIPNFTDLRGFLDGDISAKGTIADPVLTGNANITKGRLFFTWNGLYYRFETSLKTDKSDLIVERFSIFNDRDQSRHIDVFGKINFAGLSVNDIDLTTSGDMYFLDGSSIQNRFGFYGEMLGGIGTPPIRIKGNLRNLLVSGQLVIKSAKLYFPAISSLAYDIYSDDFTYRILTDSSGFRFLDTTITVSNEDIGNLDPFLRYNYILEKREPTVADYITYDLDILMEKNIVVNVNMNSLTREELNGEFQGNLRLDNRTSDRRFQLFGRLNIVGDSYYRFYKNFSIGNSYLEFNGDYNNPALNIKAEYKNVRTVDNNQEITFVVLDISGTRYQPKLTLSLRNNDGVKKEGPEAQTEAISYLLFGGPIAQGSTALGSLSNNVSSGFASSLLYEALRNIAPFIVNTEVIYNGGNISNTDIKITSAFGDAIVKFGGKILSNINNLEVSVEYPLNKLLNIDVSNNLLIQISRTYSNSIFNSDQGFESRAGLTYKIRY